MRPYRGVPVQKLYDNESWAAWIRSAGQKHGRQLRDRPGKYLRRPLEVEAPSGCKCAYAERPDPSRCRRQLAMCELVAVLPESASQTLASASAEITRARPGERCGGAWWSTLSLVELRPAISAIPESWQSLARAKRRRRIKHAISQNNKTPIAEAHRCCTPCPLRSPPKP